MIPPNRGKSITGIFNVPVYISLNGTLNIPVMLFPLLGGIIVQHISYTFLFIVTTLLILVGLFISFTLEEPRDKSNAGTTMKSL